MANRSVSVELVAKTEKYTAPIIAAKDETEGLDKKVEALNRDLDKTTADAAKAAAALKLLGAETQGAGEKFAGWKNGATNSLEAIDKEIEKTRTSFQAFAEDFNRTGSSTSLAGLLGAKTNLSDLEKLKKDVSSALSLGAEEGEKVISKSIKTGGEEGSKSLLSSIQGALSSPVLGPITVGALLGAIAAASPAIGAAIGAAFVGGTGIGLIGLGIAGQINSAPVQAAFGQLKQHATDDLTGASSVFQSALVGGLHAITNELDHIAPDVQRNLSKIAGPAENLFGGIATAVDRLGPGIDALSSAAAPFLDMLASDLPALAGDFSQMFQDIAANSPGAIMFFHDLLHWVGSLAIALGETAGVLEKTYGYLREVAAAMGGGGPLAAAAVARDLLTMKGAQDAASKSAQELKVNMEVAGASLDLAGGKAMSASDQFGSLIKQLNETNNTADTVAGAMSDKLFNSMMDADQAALHWDESLTKLSTDLIKGKDSLNEHTAAGQKNIGAILAAVQANIRQYDTNIANKMSASEAAAAYDENTRALYKQANQAGITTDKLDGLIGKYKNVPDNVDTEIATKGLTNAIDNLSSLLALINRIPNYKEIKITTDYETAKHSGPAPNMNSGYALGGIRRAAAGLIVQPSDPGTLIGEPQTGGEALIPLRGISPGRAAALGQVAMDGYGLDVVPRAAWRAVGGSGPQTLQLAATFVLPSGEVTHQQLITYALNTGRQPAQLWPAANR